MSDKTLITPEMIMTSLGINKTELKLWESKGLRDAKSGRNYKPREFYLWYRDNIYRPNLAEGNDTGEAPIEDVMTHRARYEKARAEKYQIKLERLKARYVPIEEAELALDECMGLFEEIATRLPEELSKMLVGEAEDGMLVKIDQHVRKTLLEYSRGGHGDNQEDD